MNHHPVSPSSSAAHAHTSDGAAYELRFESLFADGRGLSFPCDAEGRVEMSSLSDKALCNYLYARAVVGREYRTPAVRRHGMH
jgi:hypothetical protein